MKEGVGMDTDPVTQQYIDDLESEMDDVIASGKTHPPPGEGQDEDALDGPGKTHGENEAL